MMRPALTFILLVGLFGCNESDPSGQRKPANRTVLQFLDDPAALEETWARCRNDPGSIGESAECRNVGHAKERIMMLGRERAIRSLKS